MAEEVQRPISRSAIIQEKFVKHAFSHKPQAPEWRELPEVHIYRSECNDIQATDLYMPDLLCWLLKVHNLLSTVSFT